MRSTAVLVAAVAVASVALVCAMPLASELPHARVPAGYGAVPGGKLAHQSCVHRVPSGTTARKDALTGEWLIATPDTDGGDVETRLPRCAHALYRRRTGSISGGSSGSGIRSTRLPARSVEGSDAESATAPGHGPAWIVDALQDDVSGGGFSYFATNWSVPSAPTNPGDVLLYYWPGLEDQAMGDVLQPVLQYGAGPYGGGEYWLFQSWFVSGDGTVLVGDQTAAIPVGTAVWGSMALTADGAGYTSTAVAPGVSGSPSVLTVSAAETQLQTRAYVTVEVYNIASDCSVLPPDNALAFTAIALRDGNDKPVTPAFSAETQHEVCDHKIVLGADSVTITWKA